MKVVILDRSNPVSVASPAYAEAYRTWHEVWTEAYGPKGVTHLFSDGFTRQDYVVAFYMNGKCASLMCFIELDLKNPIHRNDSRLDGWPSDVLDTLQHTYPKVLVANNLTVPREFRRQKYFGVTMKEVGMASVFQLLLHCDRYPAAIGSLRLTKGSDGPAYQNGATFVRKVDHLGEPTDLCVFEKAKYTPTPALAAFFAQYWMPELSAA